MAHEHLTQAGRHHGRLLLVLAMTAAFMLVEAAAGILTGSLVLLADAGHMLADVAALSFAAVAVWLAQRPAGVNRTFGYYRAEVLVALLNALLLFTIAGYILFEAWQRFRSPADVAGLPLLAVASIGLVVNLAGARLLMSGARQSMNVRGAYLEVLADLLGSIGAIAAGVILLASGWRYADPLFAAGVGLFILPRGWHLLCAALDVLLEAAPSQIDVDEVRESMQQADGVRSVHDLHIWTVTSGFVALSSHVEVSDGVDRDRLLLALRSRLAEGFGIDHVTIQLEDPRLAESLGQPCLPGELVCAPTEAIAERLLPAGRR
ncbi:MAG TPA: cation diffusion facilitator family transporter [Dehalococcoidia bacterium]|nr:cation diffusion facilitator family transporter [Dehalococcoidia bacterium]